MVKVLQFWDNLRSSLWFVPTIIVGLSMLLAVFAVEWSTRVDPRNTLLWPRLYASGADGARGTLEAIGGSMITVAGVTYSITIAALAQASTQYTPRILRHFMRDRWNQSVLGVFLGIFVYCLIVLRTIRGGDEGLFVPSMAVVLAVALALVGIGFLIFFIHHVALSLQASAIVAVAARETLDATDRLFPEAFGKPSEDAEVPWELSEGKDGWRSIPARKTGYIQSLDADGILNFACKRDTVVRMERGVGEYVVIGQALVSVPAKTPAQDDEAAAVDLLYAIGWQRTMEQDTAFGIQEIVDIALKALSPGINDTTTAVVCLDNLAAILGCLAGRQFPASRRMRNGVLRVLARAPNFQEMAELALAPIRRNAEGNVTVLRHMLTVIETVGGMARSDERRRVLAAHARIVATTAERGVADPDDRVAISRRAEQVVWALNVFGGKNGSSEGTGPGLLAADNA